MATSPSHRFGQVIGNSLERIVLPILKKFCDERGLYLDKQGERVGVRSGKKLSWEDKYGNIHDLDFVIEKNGTQDTKGIPIAFIEVAWRRYTKHSRNKAQEIQGAVLPIAELYNWDKPFLGAVLAGVFTKGSLEQLKSVGFDVLFFPYETVVESFKSVGIDARFDEETPDDIFAKCVDLIAELDEKHIEAFDKMLMELNKNAIDSFLKNLLTTLDRMIDSVIVIPLFGGQNTFSTIQEAVTFVNHFDISNPQDGQFRKFEVIVKYSNGDKIDAQFQDKEKTVSFLNRFLSQQ